MQAGVTPTNLWCVCLCIVCTWSFLCQAFLGCLRDVSPLAYQKAIWDCWVIGRRGPALTLDKAQLRFSGSHLRILLTKSRTCPAVSACSGLCGLKAIWRFCLEAFLWCIPIFLNSVLLLTEAFFENLMWQGPHCLWGRWTPEGRGALQIGFFFPWSLNFVPTCWKLSAGNFFHANLSEKKIIKIFFWSCDNLHRRFWRIVRVPVVLEDVEKPCMFS